MSLLPGARLRQYEILGRLGAGGMGEVYRARDTKLGREVAIKILPAEVVKDPERLARFEREAQAVSTLNHPNIVTLYEVGTSEDGPYLVLEKIAGHPLRQTILAGPLPMRRLLALGTQIADGLAKAHAAGIVHRDLKPDNVMVTDDGFVKIVDFGLAKLVRPELDAGGVHDATTVADETMSGMILGTLGYLSPEQAAGKPADYRADQFALGALLYEMATGERPFRRDTVLESLVATSREDPEPLRSKRSDVPPPLAWMVERCLAKDPNQRYASTSDLARDLATLRDHVSEIARIAPEGTAPSAVSARRRPWLAAMLLLSAAVVIGASGAYLVLRMIPPTYRLLTFKRGVITGARFSTDGKSVFYSGAFGAEPSRVFMTRLEGTASELINLQDPANLLSVSGKGELAVLVTNVRTERNQPSLGTLARVATVGGMPRNVSENARDADWAPDGERFLVLAGDGHVEFPAGKTLIARDARWPRMSPKGDRIAAYVLGAGIGGTDGALEIVDLEGNPVLSQKMHFVYSLAWTPNGREVWFTGAETGSGDDRALYAWSLAGQLRLIARVPGAITLEDIAPDGKSALIVTGAGWSGVTAVRARQTQEQSLDLYGRTDWIALSNNGKWMVANETREVGKGVYLSALDPPQQTPLHLGDGVPVGVSENGTVLVSSKGTPPRFITVSTAGIEVNVQMNPPVEPVSREGEGGLIRAQWSSGDRRLFASLKPAGGKDQMGRIYVREGDRWQFVTPEGVSGNFAVSPDGAMIATRDATDTVSLYRTDGSAPQPIEGERRVPLLWSSDGWLYLRAPGQFPVHVYRRNLATGHTELWRDVALADPAGVDLIRQVLLAEDGNLCVFQYLRGLNELFLATGLR